MNGIIQLWLKKKNFYQKIKITSRDILVITLRGNFFPFSIFIHLFSLMQRWGARGKGGCANPLTHACVEQQLPRVAVPTPFGFLILLRVTWKPRTFSFKTAHVYALK